LEGACREEEVGWCSPEEEEVRGAGETEAEEEGAWWEPETATFAEEERVGDESAALPSFSVKGDSLGVTDARFDAPQPMTRAGWREHANTLGRGHHEERSRGRCAMSITAGSWRVPSCERRMRGVRW
jgi:hypothetical protein